MKQERWIIVTASLGLFLSTLDTGIINIALPALTQTFHASISLAAWTVTFYLIVLIVALLPLGQWADRVGRVTAFRWGLMVFLGASVGCALAPSLGWLIAARGLQGLGAAFLQATATALIATQLPPERRPTALATLGMIQGLGPVVGPGLGGLLLSLGSWHWLFWVNVPLCLLGLLGVRFFQPMTSQAGKGAINLVSSILLGLSLLCGLLALNTPQLSSSVHVALTALTLALGVAFVLLDKRQAAPLVLPQFQSQGELRLLVGLTGVIGAATTVVFLVPPFLWTERSHFQAWQVGLLALAAPAAFTVAARLTPKLRGLEYRFSLLVLALWLMTLGLGITALMLQWQSGVALCLPLLVYGGGAGILQVEAVTRMTAQVSAEIQATLGGTQRLVQNLGIALSSALVGSLLTRVSLVAGGQTAFWGAAGLTFFALLMTANQRRRVASAG